MSDQVLSPGTTTAVLTMSLATGDNQIAGLQADVTFPIEGSIAVKANGEPDCTVNPAINKGGTSFAFRPNGCGGTGCSTVRVLVLAIDNVDPIPDGSVLFSCNVSVAPGFIGTLNYTLLGVILSDPNGGKVLPVNNQNGTISIPGGPTSTRQPTPPIPSTATPQPTWTPYPTWTPSPTWTPTLTGYCGTTAGTCTPPPTSTPSPTSPPLVVPVFTCHVSSPPPSGELLYGLSGVILSDPAGNVVKDAGDQDGQICFGDGCPPPRSAPAGPALWIPDQTLDVSTTLPTITVEFLPANAEVAGLQCDISYPANAPIAAKANGKPDCTVNPDIDKDATSFAFRPSGCSGNQCSSVRALVLSGDNVDPILPVFPGNGGIPTGTPTAPLLQATPTIAMPEGTGTPTPLLHPTLVSSTSTPSPTSTTGHASASTSTTNSEGCQIPTATDGHVAWGWLAAVVGLVVRRRRGIRRRP